MIVKQQSHAIAIVPTINHTTLLGNAFAGLVRAFTFQDRRIGQ